MHDISSTLFAKAKKAKHKEPTCVPFSLIRLDVLGNLGSNAWLLSIGAITHFIYL